MRRNISTIIVASMILLLVVGFLLSMLFLKGMAVYITVIAIGIALALQKYVSSFFGYFAIILLKPFSVGNRIRIGNLKGDVTHIGLLHFTLDEVGEDEKLGGELTGRLLYVPNLIILDQPVLNYSKVYSTKQAQINCEYIFDEVRVPLTTDSNINKAVQVLEETITAYDGQFIEEAKKEFKDNYPNFLNEVSKSPRILVHIEPQKIWLKGKFVAPFRIKNELRTKILMDFAKEVGKNSDIKFAS